MSTRKRHLTVKQAAERIGITPGRLHQMIRAGECRAEKFIDERFPSGYAYEVPEKEADRIKNTQQTVGRPRSGVA